MLELRIDLDSLSVLVDIHYSSRFHPPQPKDMNPASVSFNSTSVQSGTSSLLDITSAVLPLNPLRRDHLQVSGDEAV